MMLLPKERLNSIAEITPEYLGRKKIKALLLDIDNTLVEHGSMGEREELKPWFASLAKAGVACRFISNGKPARIRHWENYFGVPAVGLLQTGPLAGFAAKPLTTAISRAVKELQLQPSEVALVGDQLFTDVLSGNLACCYTILVQPLSDRSLPHTKLLRMLERNILKRRRR